MRIKNNNNIGFGAYFKNNELFKKIYSDSCHDVRSVDKEILDRFVKECPDHEIEMMSYKVNLYGGQFYTVFNNMTGGRIEVAVHYVACPFNAIMEKLIKRHESETLGKEGGFWKNSPMIDNFKALTGIK